MKRHKHHHEINSGAEFVEPRPLPSSRNLVAPYDHAATLQTPTAPLGDAGVGMSAFQVPLNKSPSSAFKKTPSPHHANHVYQQSNTTQAQLEDNEVASINQDHGQQLPPPQNHQVEHEAQRGDLFHGQEVKGDPLVGNGRSPAFSLTSPAYSLTSPMPSPGLTDKFCMSG